MAAPFVCSVRWVGISDRVLIGFEPDIIRRRWLSVADCLIVESSIPHVRGDYSGLGIQVLG